MDAHRTQEHPGGQKATVGRRGEALVIHRPAIATLVISGLLFGVASAAEPDATPAAEAGDTFAEVVVTARRKAENIEKVPTAITALSSDEMQQRGIYSEADLQRSVPGLTIRETQNSNSLNYSIRGQTVDGFSSSHPGVLSYVNDVQMTALSASSFYDLQSVQVLKGPQGTLFGRNTTGGAVLYTTAKPTDTLGGSLTARFGNFSRKEVEGNLNVPLIADKLLLRFAGRFVRREGYEINLTTAGDVGGPSDLGADRSQSGRVSLLFHPIDGLENDLVLQFTNVDTTTAGGVLYSLNKCGSAGLNTTAACLYDPTFDAALFGPYAAAHPQAYPGGITAFLGLQQARGPYLVNFNSPSFFRSNNPSATNTTTYTVNPDLLVKNILGYSDSRIHYSTDADGSPYTIYNYGPFGQTIGQFTGDRQYSEEFQLQGKTLGQALNYIIGLYYADERIRNYLPQNFFELAPLLVLPPSNNDFEQISKSGAIFSQGTYNLASLTGVAGLSVTGGFRYTWEQITSDQLARSSYVTGLRELKKTFHDPSWTFGLEYQATQSLLLYVTQRGSWRSGGFNGYKAGVPGLAAVGGSLFLPETTKDVEVGAKFDGRIGDRPFRLNIAAYNQWAKDLQRVVYVPINGNPTAVTASVPKAIISGFELDTEYSPVRWLTVGGGVAYTGARFTDNTVNLFGVTTVFGPYPDTPAWTGNLFAQLELPVPAKLGSVSLRADTYYQSKFYFSSTNATINPGTEIPSYGVTNFRLNWDHIANSRLGAALFVTNAFDKIYFTGGLAVGSVFGLNTAVPAKPRMYGGEIRMSF